MYLGSDAIALAPFTDTIAISRTATGRCSPARAPRSATRAGPRSSATIVKSTASAQLVDKGNHKHFMAKEIHEQPEVVGHTLAHYIDMVNERVALPGKLPFDWTKLKRLSISACGTAFYAGLVAKYWFERFAQAAGRNRYRLGIPLSRRAARGGRSRDLHLAVGRDRRHAGDTALRAGKQAAHSVGGQRADLDNRERKRRGHADARRARDRRRIHEGLHLPAERAGLPCHCRGSRARRTCPKRTSRTLCAP